MGRKKEKIHSNQLAVAMSAKPWFPVVRAVLSWTVFPICDVIYFNSGPPPPLAPLNKSGKQPI